MAMKNKTDDFELFKDEFKKWQERFGLNGWKVYFKHMPLEGVFAQISPDLSGMVATVKLNSELEDDEKPFKDIKRTAKHEAIHLLISRLETNGRCRYISDAEMKETVEELTIKLEGLIQ